LYLIEKLNPEHSSYQITILELFQKSILIKLERILN